MLQQMIEDAAQGNTEALEVACDLAEYLPEQARVAFQILKEQGIVGSELCNLCYDCCSGDVAKLHAVIMAGTGQEKLRQVSWSSFYVAKILEEQE